MTHTSQEAFKDEANQKLVELHTYFYQFSPLALLLIFVYLGLSIFHSPNGTIALCLRVFLILFFSAEFIVEFLLYKDKKELVLQNIWKLLLIVPVIGFLRILGRLAQLFKVLSLVKIGEQSLKTLNCYIFDGED